MLEKKIQRIDHQKLCKSILNARKQRKVGQNKEEIIFFQSGARGLWSSFSSVDGNLKIKTNFIEHSFGAYEKIEKVLSCLVGNKTNFINRNKSSRSPHKADVSYENQENVKVNKSLVADLVKIRQQAKEKIIILHQRGLTTDLIKKFCHKRCTSDPQNNYQQKNILKKSQYFHNFFHKLNHSQPDSSQKIENIKVDSILKMQRKFRAKMLKKQKAATKIQQFVKGIWKKKKKQVLLQKLLKSKIKLLSLFKGYRLRKILKIRKLITLREQIFESQRYLNQIQINQSLRLIVEQQLFSLKTQLLSYINFYSVEGKWVIYARKEKATNPRSFLSTQELRRSFGPLQEISETTASDRLPSDKSPKKINDKLISFSEIKQSKSLIENRAHTCFNQTRKTQRQCKQTALLKEVDINKQKSMINYLKEMNIRKFSNDLRRRLTPSNSPDYKNVTDKKPSSIKCKITNCINSNKQPAKFSYLRKNSKIPYNIYSKMSVPDIYAGIKIQKLDEAQFKNIECFRKTSNVVKSLSFAFRSNGKSELKKKNSFANPNEDKCMKKNANNLIGHKKTPSYQGPSKVTEEEILKNHSKKKSFIINDNSCLAAGISINFVTNKIEANLQQYLASEAWNVYYKTKTTIYQNSAIPTLSRNSSFADLISPYNKHYVFENLLIDSARLNQFQFL